MKMKRKKCLAKTDLKFLQAISKLDANGFTQITPLLKSKHVNLICALCRNVLFSKLGLKLGKRTVNKLNKIAKPHRNSFLKLSNKNLDIKTKKKIISQRGGFLSSIISLAIPLITSLVSTFVK